MQSHPKYMILRNILFYAGVWPATFFFAVLITCIFFLPIRIRYWVTTRWSHFYIFWAKFTCGLRYHIEGRENIPTQNAIAVSNHQSTWETIFMQVLLPQQSWVLKRELLLIPFFGWGLSRLEPIAISRTRLSSVTQLLREGTKRLKAGRWVVIFPEGSRILPGVNKPFSRSAAALSKASDYPILPLAHNAGQFWPRGLFIKKPGTIHVKIGPLIYPEDRSVDVINTLVETWIKGQTF